MFSSVKSMGILGIDAFDVLVEADVSMGKSRFDIVGLPDTAVTESRERVRTAMKNSGFDFPNIHITVNLAPADTKKEGPNYDLPILLALLSANRQIPPPGTDRAFIGELSMNGEIRHVNGVLPMVLEARRLGVPEIFIPAANAAEASVADRIRIYAVENVRQLLAHLNGSAVLTPLTPQPYTAAKRSGFEPDFADVKGQYQAKRALTVAAAGGHNVMMIGPPGSGKSMLAKRLPSILPDMTFEEALETTKIFSVAGKLRDGGIIASRPFRSPHHTVSAPGLTGGGSIPRPGEVSMAHNGVLFLDELPEFSKTALEALRQPIENGEVSVSRVACTLTYPCSVMLVCAMNPCPCGYYGHPTRQCTCPPGAPARYLSRVSGPLMDRLDIHIEVPPVRYEELTDSTRGESSAAIRERVNAARARQQARFAGTGITCNARMTAEMTSAYCNLTPAAEKLMASVFDNLGLSARAYDKILRVARTIADLDAADTIDVPHLAEAIQYRSLDRKFRGEP